MVSIAALLFGAMLAGFLFGSPVTARRLQSAVEHKELAAAYGFLGPAVILAGIFADGHPAVMLAVLGVFALGTALVALRGVAASGTLPAESLTVQPVPAAPAPLPQTSAGELPMPDVRQLCQGLPPVLAGEVLQTLDSLEAAAQRARSGGDARQQFESEQALSEYLPQTVTAWKRQGEAGRRPEELSKALAQIRAIAEGDGGGYGGQDWEVQRRFLAEKSADKQRF
ncbi:hypothetical protein ACFP81_02110 [Deinococcus lacus]|uniref:Uncharacterized protein n=1 Tax=Deinococcus lacus TaxID=392561 RepID=A0ABW1Y9F3_9DEIO